MKIRGQATKGAVRRGAPLKGEPSARSRILDVASDLFYREGIQTTGVDTIVERSGVSKTSLYRAFPSKDDLIKTVLDDKNQGYWAWWDGVTAKAADEPEAQLRAIISAIVRHIGSSAYRGCPLLNAAAEFGDADHAVHVAARASKDELKRRLTELSRAFGVRHPARVGHQVAMLINGAYASAMAMPTASLESDLTAAAFAIIEADAGPSGRKSRPKKRRRST